MNDFSRLITFWYRLNKRELPWRTTNNPYYIWLSEIILQQTRVDQGLNYYRKFIKNYPTIKDLADATEEQVLNDWQGLGYYSRGRNLLKSAKQIQDEFNGEFPDNYNDIIKLKGVGQYTASAISSFAFKEKKAVVDGNVYRLLSRYFNIDTPIDSTKGKKEFQLLADELISNNHPDIHNQAIMELGAMICTPKKAKCEACPLNDSCLAFQKKSIYQLPVKSKKTKVTKRYFHFFFYQFDGETYIEKRIEKDIWQNMYQFPMIELFKEKEVPQINQTILKEFTFKHLLSHQTIFAHFYIILQDPLKTESEWMKIKISELENYPLPKLMEKFCAAIEED